MRVTVLGSGTAARAPRGSNPRTCAACCSPTTTPTTPPTSRRCSSRCASSKARRASCSRARPAPPSCSRPSAPSTRRTGSRAKRAICRGADVAILDAKARKPSEGHMTPAECVAVAEACGVRRLVLTHLEDGVEHECAAGDGLVIVV